MFKRFLSLPIGLHSFFLFGPRQTGKTTLVEKSLANRRAIKINLMQTDTFVKYARDPSLFRREALLWMKQGPPGVVFIDEVQRLPGLLNEVQVLMEASQEKTTFIMTGSSARKLKRTSVNLLGGRAWSFVLHPLTHDEMGGAFDIADVMRHGSLPPVAGAEPSDRVRTLRAYAHTYLKEEVLDEALVRKMPAFSRFLELAADQSGMPVNYTNMAAETGVRSKTIREYYQLLEDTLLAFALPPYRKSARKRLTTHPVFYLFDLGVTNALCGRLQTDVIGGTDLHGRLFEQFIVLELRRLMNYREKDWGMFYWRTTHGAEVDLILDTGRRLLAIEIKSAKTVRSQELKGLRGFLADYPGSEALCVSDADRPYKIGEATCLPWRDFFGELFA